MLIKQNCEGTRRGSKRNEQTISVALVKRSVLIQLHYISFRVAYSGSTEREQKKRRTEKKNLKKIKNHKNMKKRKQNARRTLERKQRNKKYFSAVAAIVSFTSFSREKMRKKNVFPLFRDKNAR